MERTLGTGNHFLEFERGAVGFLWLMVHSRSRGKGKAMSVSYCHILRHSKPSATIDPSFSGFHRLQRVDCQKGYYRRF